jgi:hypothetical protein
MRKFVQCSLNQIMDGNPSSIYDIYNLEWFVALWNETQVDNIPTQYKEELSITLIESTLQVREDIVKNGDRNEKDPALLNIKLQNWITISLEVAEIASKVLDWKTPNPKYEKESKSAAGGDISIGINACKDYLLLIEEISFQSELLGNDMRKKELV